jgi:hypothetical protein
MEAQIQTAMQTTEWIDPTYKRAYEILFRSRIADENSHLSTQNYEIFRHSNLYSCMKYYAIMMYVENEDFCRLRYKAM